MRSREIEEEKSQNGCGEEAEKKKEDIPSDVTESVVILGSYIFFSLCTLPHGSVKHLFQHGTR
jgi:hypothetical protein